MRKRRWKIDGQTKVFAVFGQSVRHSLSPTIHNASFEDLGVNCVFIGLSSSQYRLETAIKGMAELGIKGAAIIIPYKVEVMKYCTEIDLMARQIGAVNTIEFREDHSIIGHNTDAEASARAILEVRPMEGSHILLLGAGGAARAIAFQTGIERVKSLTIANRTLDKAVELCEQISDTFDHQIKTKPIALSIVELKHALRQTDIVINTTSVGMDSKDTLLTSNMLRPDMTVLDIVYTPYQTKLLQEAEKVGAKTIPGANMLIYQAIEQERIWLKGVKPSFKVMKNALMEELEGGRR